MAYSYTSLTKTSATHSPARLRSALSRIALKAAFGAAVVIGVLGAGQAHAFVVDVNGKKWSVTTFTGTYTANSTKFATPPAPGKMPWFGNQSLAETFATAVGSALGFPNPPGSGILGPYFTYRAPDNTVNNSVACNASLICNITYGPAPSDNRFWAQADEVVPGPLPLFGAAAAFGCSRKLRNRINDSKVVGPSFTAA